MSFRVVFIIVDITSVGNKSGITTSLPSFPGSPGGPFAPLSPFLPSTNKHCIRTTNHICKYIAICNGEIGISPNPGSPGDPGEPESPLSPVSP